MSFGWICAALAAGCLGLSQWCYWSDLRAIRRAWRDYQRRDRALDDARRRAGVID